MLCGVGDAMLIRCPATLCHKGKITSLRNKDSVKHINSEYLTLFAMKTNSLKSPLQQKCSQFAVCDKVGFKMTTINKELEMNDFFEKYIASEESRKDLEAKLIENIEKLQQMENKYSSLQQRSTALKKEYDESQKEKDMLRTALNLKNEALQKQEKVCKDLKEKLEKVENEFIKREHCLEIEVSNRNQIIDQLQNDLKRIQIQTENSIKQFDDVLNQKMELETKLSHVLDEKVNLFEKCRFLEEDNDHLKTEALQAKSKLDDTVAALHELGRENQMLQVAHTKLMSKRWTEDDEVKNCTSCNKQFSLAVRKHHCRSCLQIFCNECSSKVAIIPSHSSNKPVRVCHTCFAEFENQ